MTIKEIKEYFSSLKRDEVPLAIENYKDDPRKGVQKICKSYKIKHENFIKEDQRIQAMVDFDNVFREKQGVLVGIDEAGRGPLAGPVVATAVILPASLKIAGINDSKKLSKNQREQLYVEIMEKSIGVGIGIVDSKTIDKINILQATFKAMEEAVGALGIFNGLILVDGNQTIPGLAKTHGQHSIVKGDAKSISIAAAGIIAKVTRDRIMVEYDLLYPEYGLSGHKGYGSLKHQDMIRKYGPSPIHRMSFLKNIL